MVVDLAELPRVQAELSGHLHVGMREVEALARIDPVPELLRELLLAHAVILRRASDGMPRSTPHHRALGWGAEGRGWEAPADRSHACRWQRFGRAGSGRRARR